MFGTLANFDQAHINQAVAEAGPGGYILFLNEPDNTGISAASACTAWETLATDSGVVANHIRLVSPSLAGAVTAGDWLEQWFACITHTPAAISVHAYDSSITSGFVPNVAANVISTRIAQHKAKWPGYPLWITEWGSNATNTNSLTASQNAQLMDVMIPRFESDFWVQNYFWFYGGPASIAAATIYPGRNLYDDAAAPTTVGTHYKSFPH